MLLSYLMFDLAKAREFLTANPRGFADAMRKADPPTLTPDFKKQTQKKRDHYKIVENEMFPEPLLAAYRSRLTSNSANSSLKDGEAKNMKKAIEKAQDSRSKFEAFDAQVREFLSNHFIKPFEKNLSLKKSEVYESYKKIVSPETLQAMGDSPDGLQQFMLEKVKEGFYNVAETFIGLVYVIPQVYERMFNQKMPIAELQAAIPLAKNLVREHAQLHSGQQAILKEFAIKDEPAMERRVDDYGKGETPEQRMFNYSQSETKPAFHIYKEDCFELIQADQGLELVHNTKALENYDKAIRGVGIKPYQRKLLDIYKRLITRSGATVKCPALRIT